MLAPSGRMDSRVPDNEGRQESHTDLIFIGGIHGVGKTTYCRALAPRLHLRHVTAGDLIRAGGATRVEKTVDDVDLNQARLIAALNAIKAADESILLDGHFCLLGTTFSIVPIPLEVFAHIAPTRILLMEADANEVDARLRQRGTRGLDLRLINEFATAERAHATAVSLALNVPLRVIGADTSIEELHQFLV